MHKILKSVFLFSLLFSFHSAFAQTYAPGAITGNVTWTKADGPYIVDTLYIPEGSSLTIEPGTIVKLGQASCNCYTNIYVYGRLIVGAQGASERAVITSINDDVGGDTNGTTTTPAPGDWRQISVGAQGVLELYSADVRYGGLATAPGIYFNPANVRQINNAGTVVMDDVDIGYGYDINYNQSWSGTTTIRNSHIHDAPIGLSFLRGIATVEDNTFSTVGTAMQYPLNDLTLVHKDNHGTSGIALSGTPLRDITLTSDTMPYIMGGMNIPQGVTLTILPGTIIKIPGGAYGLSVSGVLVTGSATSTDKVFITSILDDTIGGDTNGDGSASVPGPGNWGEVRINDGGIGSITNTTIRYGGSYVYDYWGSLWTSPVVQNSYGTLSLSLSTITDGKKWLLFSSGTTTATTSEFTRGEYGVYVQNGSTAINNSSIHDNTQYGVYNATTNIVDATNNWWGSANGPRLPLSVVGAGDMVSLNVDYTSWLGAEPRTTTPTTTPSDVCVTDCYSNVLFLPGLEASRLYRPDYNGGTERLWEPELLHNNSELFLDSDGVSNRSDIYTRDVVDNAYLPVKGNIYKSFLEDLDTWKNDEHLIVDYAAIPYDWRISLEDILGNGNNIDGRIYYSGDNAPTTTPYIIQELRRLAASSKTGKVTIVAHSNGGLVTKALTDKLGAEAATLIDQIIFVAVPQVGTPQAIGAILHGYDQGLLTDAFSFFLSESTARTLAQNMPSAYNLLPSTSYFTYVDDPVVTFDNSPLLAPWRARYGDVIHSRERLHNFVADQSRTPLPVSDDLIFPISGNETLLNSAETLHDTSLDNWIPPEGVALTEIAGWGEKTLKTIEYKQGWKTSCSDLQDIYTCTDVPALEYEVKEVLDGDGTVVVPSALWTATSTGVKKYWVDLNGYNNTLPQSLSHFDRKHADILEVPELRTLIQNIFTNSTSTFPTFISTSTPPNPNSDTRLRFTLHSPLALNLYDELGNHTGISTTTGFLEENIPGSRYKTYGELKYVEAPASTTLHLAMNGYKMGSFTLDVEKELGDIVVASTTFAAIPTLASTTVTTTIPTGGDIASATPLLVDYNGDGVIDLSLKPKVGRISVFDVTPPEAIITLDSLTQTLKIVGTDNLSSATVLTTATSSTVTDEAGNTLEVIFKKLRQEKHELKLEIQALRYNGVLGGDIPKTALQYAWSLDKAGNLKELEEKVSVGASTIESHYDAKKNVTRIRKKLKEDIKGDKEKIEELLPRLVIVKLMTEKGEVKID